jgi:hypothetical protein
MMMFQRMPSHAHRQTTVDVSPIVTKKKSKFPFFEVNKNPAKDFCSGDLDAVVGRCLSCSGKMARWTLPHEQPC